MGLPTPHLHPLPKSKSSKTVLHTMPMPLNPQVLKPLPVISPLTSLLTEKMGSRKAGGCHALFWVLVPQTLHIAWVCMRWERGAANPRNSCTHSLDLVGSSHVAAPQACLSQAEVAAIAEGWEVGRRGRESAGSGFTN